MSKVSVIVPIYKVENYLKKCIESVLSQTESDFQLILVDDGSPDRCPLICDDYAKRDSRITVIHKKNGGLSSARNVAYDSINSEFSLFLDSDDFLEKDALEFLLKKQAETNADVVVGNYFYTYSNHENEAVIEYDESSVSGYEALEMLAKGKVQNFAWGKLIKSELLKKHKFTENVFFEDFFWTHYIFAEAVTVNFSKRPIVHYRQRENSISFSFSEKNLDMIEGWRARLTYFKENYPELMPVYSEVVSKGYLAMAWNISVLMKKGRKEAQKKLRTFGRDFSLSQYGSSKTKRMMKIFEHSAIVFVFLETVNKIIYKLKMQIGVNNE